MGTTDNTNINQIPLVICCEETSGSKSKGKRVLHLTTKLRNGLLLFVLLSLLGYGILIFLFLNNIIGISHLKTANNQSINSIQRLEATNNQSINSIQRLEAANNQSINSIQRLEATNNQSINSIQRLEATNNQSVGIIQRLVHRVNQLEKKVTFNDTSKRAPKICPMANWSTTAVTVAGGLKLGSALNQLNHPLDIFVDKHDAIYIADSLNHRIVIWDESASEGRVVIGGAGEGNQSHQFHHVTAMFMDSEESIYVADNHNNRIQKWTKDSTRGETIIGKNGRGKGSNQINNCWGLYVDREFNVYVSEHSNHRVTKWSPGAQTGRIVAQVDKPIGIHVDEWNDDIYVASYSDNSIQQFSQNSTFIRKIGLSVLKSPYDFAIIPGSDPNNRAVIIADTERHRIVKMHMNNANEIQIIAGVTDVPDDKSNHFNEPRGVRFDAKGNLLIVDSNNHRVQKLLIMNNTCDV